MTDNPLPTTTTEGMLAADTRPAVCVCGREFIQWRISDRFLAAAVNVALHEGLPVPSVIHKIPSGYVPIFCPPCETFDLAATAVLPTPPMPNALADERRRERIRIYGTGVRDIDAARLRSPVNRRLFGEKD